MWVNTSPVTLSVLCKFLSTHFHKSLHLLYFQQIFTIDIILYRLPVVQLSKEITLCSFSASVKMRFLLFESVIVLRSVKIAN